MIQPLQHGVKSLFQTSMSSTRLSQLPGCLTLDQESASCLTLVS